MNPSEDLFQLIKSLSPAEKRYFKMEVSGTADQEKNNYIKLFEVIENQKKYDEEQVRFFLKNEKFVNHLRITKNQLYNLILNILHQYNLDNGIEFKIKKLFVQIRILHKKELFGQAYKILEKAKNLAERYEMYDAQLEVLSLYRMLWMDQLFIHTEENDILNYSNKLTEIIKNIDNTHQYVRLQLQFSFLNSKIGGLRKNEHKNKYYEILNNPLLKEEGNALTGRGKQIFNLIHSIYNLMFTKDSNKAYLHMKRTLDLIEAQPHLIAEYPERYVRNITNLIASAVGLGKEEEAFSLIKKIRSIPEMFKIKWGKDDLKTIFIHPYTHELHLYAKKGNFEKINSLINNIEKDVAKYGESNNIPFNIVRYFNIAHMYFGIGEYRTALKWINKILLQDNINVIEHLFCSSKIMQLILHYELKNEILPYVVKSTYRYLSKKNRLYKFENIILDFMQEKMFQPFSQKELIIFFGELKKEIEEIMKDPYEAKALDYFDFISWLESKIEQKSYGEIVKSKIKA